MSIVFASVACSTVVAKSYDVPAALLQLFDLEVLAPKLLEGETTPRGVLLDRDLFFLPISLSIHRRAM